MFAVAVRTAGSLRAGSCIERERSPHGMVATVLLITPAAGCDEGSVLTVDSAETIGESDELSSQLQGPGVTTGYSLSPLQDSV